NWAPAELPSTQPTTTETPTTRSTAAVAWRSATCATSCASTPATSSGDRTRRSKPSKTTIVPPGSEKALTTSPLTTSTSIETSTGNPGRNRSTMVSSATRPSSRSQRGWACRMRSSAAHPSGSSQALGMSGATATASHCIPHTRAPTSGRATAPIASATRHHRCSRPRPCMTSGAAIRSHRMKTASSTTSRASSPSTPRRTTPCEGSSTRRSAARLQRATGTPSTCEISSADGVKAICTSCRAAERPSLYRPRAVIASNVAEVEDVEQALAGARHRDAALRDRCEVERAPHLEPAGEESYLPKGDERRRDAEGRDDDREVAERSAQKRPAPHGVGEGEALEGHVRREIALRARLVPDHGKTSRREKEQERQQPPTEQVAAAPVEAQRTIAQERV